MPLIPGKPVTSVSLEDLETALERLSEPIAHVVATSSSAAVGTSATAVQTLPSTTYEANRAYGVWVGGAQQPSTTTAFSNWTFYKTSTAGTLVLEFGRVPVAGFVGAFHLGLTSVFTVGGTAVTAVLLVAAQSSAGATVTHVGSSTNPRHITIRDIGPASAFPSAPVLS